MRSDIVIMHRRPLPRIEYGGRLAVDPRIHRPPIDLTPQAMTLAHSEGKIDTDYENQDVAEDDILSDEELVNLLPEPYVPSAVLAKAQETQPAEKHLVIRSGWLGRVAGLLGIGIAVAGIGVGAQRFGSIPPAEIMSAKNAVVTTANIAYTPVIPDDTPPANYLAAHVVGKTLPRYLVVPSLSVQARVLPVGVDRLGQPLMPKHSYDTGWYNVSRQPGEAGAMVVSGMCVTPATNGVLGGLHTLKKDDEIRVERGDGVTVRYQVMSSQSVPTAELDMTKVLRPADDHAPGLNIVTCAGEYDQKTNDMSARLVVYARQI